MIGHQEVKAILAFGGDTMWSPAQRSDELYHWIPFRGSKEDHKYIAKVKEGKYTRYFYTQAEYEAYKNLTNKQANPSKTTPSGLIAKAKHFVDYDLTGTGYRRDARQKNKEIDQLQKLRSEHQLQADPDKLKEYDERNKRIEKKYRSEVNKANAKAQNKKPENAYAKDIDDRRNQSSASIERERDIAKANRDRQLDYSNKAREEYKDSAKRKNLAEQLAADREKKANTEQAEKDYKNKSLVGKATKVGDFIRNFNRNLEDQKTAKWMKKNSDYAEKWMKELGIDKKVYDPTKDADADKLKKYLRRNKNSGNGAVSDLRDGESLNDYLERKGLAKKEKGKTRYFKKKQNRRKNSASLKHSEYREQWLKEIGSEENQEYDPEKEKELLQRMKNDEVEKRRKKKEENDLKHSDDDITSLMTYSAELYHYGRKGMKWYQHIYGPVQSVAKYAKKAGSKMAEAKQKHDTKAEAKWEAKKEKVIRSGNAKAIRKISDKLTDDELRRADNRINEKNRLDSMAGRQQQGQQFVKQQGNQNSTDFINDFNSFVNKATSTYNSIDKLVKTYDDIQKYMPENRAKAAEKKKTVDNLLVSEFLAHPERYNSKEAKDFENKLKSFKNIKELADQAGALGPPPPQSSNNSGGKKKKNNNNNNNNNNNGITEDDIVDLINSILEDQRNN